MKTTPLIFLFLLIIIACCKKENPPNTPQLPPETQTGANTFGCLVNGQVWLPKGGGLLQSIFREYYNGAIIIRASNTKSNDKVNINVVNIFSDTIFIINGTQNFYYMKVIDISTSTAIWSFPDSLRTGEFNLKKLDTINRIMSGTFWFDAIDTTTNNIIQIRDGRFDIKY